MTYADWRSGHTREDLLEMLAFLHGHWSQRWGWVFGAAVMRRVWDLLTDPRFRELVEAAEGRGAGRCSAEHFELVRGRLPQIGNWRPPEPSPLLWEPPGSARTFHLGGPAGRDIPPGVLNFRELPFWVQQTHHAAVALGGCSLRGLVLSAAAARADHSAEQSAELKPFDEQIDAVNRETDLAQRAHDDAVWRGMSNAGQKGEALRQRRELAEGQIRQLRSEQHDLRQRIADTAREAEHAAQANLLRCITGNPLRTMTFDPNWRTEVVSALARGVVAERAFDRLPILADALEEAGCDDPDVLSHCRTSGPHTTACWVLAGLTS